MCVHGVCEGTLKSVKSEADEKKPLESVFTNKTAEVSMEMEDKSFRIPPATAIDCIDLEASK